MKLPLSTDEHALSGTDLPELRRANEVIGQFIRSCSHGMRGPIKSIMGLVNIIASTTEKADPNLKTLLGLIEKVANSLESQLDEMEHFLENSKRRVKSQLIDWSELTKDLLARNRGEIEKAQVIVSVDIQSEAKFWSDRPRILLILNNLLSNAIHFRDPQKPGMQALLRIHATKEKCVITLSDNGIGIEEQFHKQIFDLFFRASERSSGTGIGLYVVREAVKKMGGEITVASSPGLGAEFTITLPGHP